MLHSIVREKYFWTKNDDVGGGQRKLLSLCWCCCFSTSSITLKLMRKKHCSFSARQIMQFIVFQMRKERKIQDATVSMKRRNFSRILK